MRHFIFFLKLLFPSNLQLSRGIPSNLSRAIKCNLCSVAYIQHHIMFPLESHLKVGSMTITGKKGAERWPHLYEGRMLVSAYPPTYRKQKSPPTNFIDKLSRNIQ